MKNKDLIIKVARRLDKFNLDEIIVVSELQEQEVKEILSDLIKEQVIIKSSNKYFFNNIQPFFIVYLIMVSHILTKYIYLISTHVPEREVLQSHNRRV